MPPKRGWDRIYLFFALTYVGQGLAGFVYEPISYLLKDRLHLTAGQSSVFEFWMTLPFLIKPAFGLVSDLLPVGRRRRRPHFVLMAALATGAWLCLAGLRGYAYAPLLALLLLVNVGGAAGDVVCDAVMVEEGKASARTGVFQAVKIAALYLSIVATGLGGGWMTTHVSMRGSFLLAAALSATILVSSVWSREPDAASAASGAARGLRALVGQKRFWALCAFIFLWSFYPFLGAAQFYYESETLKLTPQYIGFLDTLGGLAGALGAVAYGRVVGRVWPTERLVRAAVFAGAPLALGYLFFLGPVSTAIATVVVGFFLVGLRLAVMDWAAQSCPAWAEATAFAAYMSVFNIAASASNAVGGNMYDWLRSGPLRLSGYGGAAALSCVGAACTLACWPLLGSVLRDDPARAEVAGLVVSL